ncbi:unnamed protein product [Urochloa decumbens]|uniref:Exonuclease domain-containing protein n=1 Tax=Urochloa decumbens TaxID=240449 RepID=A0ABC8VCF6_9POAL
MSKLANMFSAVHLDAENTGEDDREVEQVSFSTEETASREPDKTEQNDTIVVNYEEGKLVSSSGDYRMPLVWIDLEMTGLDYTKDRILEIACIITDGKLTKQIEVLDFVRRHISSGTPLLAGNSVYVDLFFLKKYMPQLAAIFSHVIVDVSSVMALCIRWYPKERKQTPRKRKAHRAMDDIKETIAELKYYKDNIFKPQKSKR